MTAIHRTRTLTSPVHPCGALLYVPDRAGPASGIVILHGSEGVCAGWPDCIAAQLSQFGLTCAP